MKDRSVQYPNRYRLVPVAGETNMVELYQEPGEVTEEGTPISKGTMLTDETGGFLELTGDPTVNSAIFKLAIGGPGYYGFAITLRDGNNAAIPGVTVTGVKTPNGGPSVTDENGYVFGIASVKTVTLSIPKWADYEGEFSKTVTAVDSVTNVSFVITRKAKNEIRYDSSQSFVVSPYVKRLDFCLVGGGGGGANRDEGSSGGGGGGGAIENLLNYLVNPSDTFSLEVGAGGLHGADAKAGGSTILLINGVSSFGAQGGVGGRYSIGGSGGNRVGGDGGAGNNGSSGQAGRPATVYKFNGSEYAGGGGGGGGVYGPAYGGDGGAPNGGRGGGRPNAVQNGSAPGGGGGGGCGWSNNDGSGGNGGAGGAYVRWNYGP